MKYLTAADKKQFQTQGYIAKHNTVTAEQMAAARNAIWDRLGVDHRDPSTWISSGKDGSQGMGTHPEFHALIYESPLYGMAEALAGNGIKQQRW